MKLNNKRQLIKTCIYCFYIDGHCCRYDRTVIDNRSVLQYITDLKTCTCSRWSPNQYIDIHTEDPIDETLLEETRNLFKEV